MKIPKRVKVGGHLLDVEYKSESKDGYSCMGTVRLWKNQIIIQDELCKSKKESSLIHEIIHELGLHFNLNLSESVIDSLSEGLYQVLVDNKFFGGADGKK